MKHILLSILLSVGASSLMAQEEGLKVPAQDPWYLQLYGGLNKSANENLPWSEFSKYPWSGGAFLGLGKEFSPLWGMRFVLGIDGNKSRNVQKCESPDTWSWMDAEGWADATFDITDALNGAKGSKFNLKAFAGVGGLYTWGFPKDVPLSYTEKYSKNSTMNVGGRLGLTATYALSRHWRVGAELSHQLMTDQFNGVNDHSGLDQRSNLKAGVTYVFLPRVKKQKEPLAPIVRSNRLRIPPIIPLVGVEPEVTKERQLAGRSFLDFPVNMMDIYPNYRRNPQELKRIRETINKARFDKGIEITKIELHGYASPESPYSNNTRLAKGRVASLARYLQNYFQLSPSLFQQEYTPEDWDNLRSYIDEESRRTVKESIWYNNDDVLETPKMADVVVRYRQELLSVIDSDMEPDAKEEKLKQVGNGLPYKWLHTNVYPGLRHTDYVIHYVVSGFPVSQSRKLIYVHPEALSLDEMNKVAASMRRGSDEWYDVLIIAARQYPGNKAANLNAAIASMEKRRLKDAKEFLENAGDIEGASYVRDVISAMEGTSNWKMVNGRVFVEP